MGAVGTHGSCVRTPHGKVAHRMHGIHRFFDRRTEGHIFLGAQNARTYTEFNLLAKRAKDLRAQRYWGYCRDARFVRPHSAWLSRTQNARNTQSFFDRRTEEHIFLARTKVIGGTRNARNTQKF